MSVSAHTPKSKPTLIDTTSTGVLPISNGTPCKASPERVAERHIRWLMTQKKLSLGGSVAVVEIAKSLTVSFPMQVRRQGWTTQAEVIVWVSNWGLAQNPLSATMHIYSTTDPTGETFDITGTATINAADAVKYRAVLDIGAGDRTDEQSLEAVQIDITTGSVGTSTLRVYGRKVRQLPFTDFDMELAP